jgi:hypothetical protein
MHEVVLMYRLPLTGLEALVLYDGEHEGGEVDDEERLVGDAEPQPLAVRVRVAPLLLIRIPKRIQGGEWV